MSGDLEPIARRRVGVVGAGQLARMMGEAAHDVGVDLTVLALVDDEPAAATCDEVLIGDARDPSALRRLAALVDVITFDHELVDLESLSELEDEGVTFRPDPRALRFAVDKAHQRVAFADAGLPVPRFLVVRSSGDERLGAFLESLDGPPVLKTARGGYDGRGVLFPDSRSSLDAMIDELGAAGEVLVEERLELRGEFAQLVVRAVDGALAFYPTVTTLQRDGMCVEVRFPSGLDPATIEAVRAISERVAEVVGGVGILAIEYFDTALGPLINEVALRPHNSGHWTIEGTTVSQFAQHLLAVSGQGLGSVEPRVESAVMVNVVGGAQPGSVAAARAIEGVFVHDYGKAWRPGRKLGHVTAIGGDPSRAHVRAWDGAAVYGTGTREV